MGSRKTTAHSSFGNGRSSNGNDVSGSSRSSNCSYLSNVRPENRSTLCSVMAQLAEETQPSFETTLRSKAVSESCTVKFSCVVTGYPAPQVTWYKDDEQLDRYCGLPKYEIFHNGQNHSLHIYNCTVEDAAIYQASAINLKGIVSCSGVLEVGEMNEFKIHQRYFAKLKTKAGNRSLDKQAKENQEYLRTISPDRTQRKRRSTMEAFLSTTSPTEGEDRDRSLQTEALVAESRLQEAAVEEQETKPVPVTEGAVNGQTNNENATKNKTYMYDQAQKIFTSHQPRTPFVNKKIKFSNRAKVPKADVTVKSVSSEKTIKVEPLPSVTPVCAETVKINGSSEENMEVENNVNSPAVHLDLTFMKVEHEKSAKEEVTLVESSSKDEHLSDQATVPSKRESLTASVSPVATSVSRTQSENESKKTPKHGKELAHKDTKEYLKTQKQSLLINTTQKRPSMTSTDLSRTKKDSYSTELLTAMDVNGKPNTSSEKCFELSFTESVEKPCDIRTALSQSPSEVAENQLSEKEKSPCRKKESTSQSAVPSEVTQAHTEMNRNDAPVGSELPPDWCTIGSLPPQKTDDMETPSLCSGNQALTDIKTQDTLDDSKKSSESRPEIFTHQKKRLLEIPGGTENITGCKVSPATRQSQIVSAVKTVEQTEIQDVEKVKLHKISKLAPSGKMLVMETETALNMTQQTKTGKTQESGNTDSVVGSSLSVKKNGLISTTVDKTGSKSQELKSNVLETTLPLQTQTSEKMSSKEPIIDSQKPSKPVPQVISIAELLRSQIKALDSAHSNSDSSRPAHADSAQSPAVTSPQGSHERRGENVQRKSEVPVNETEANVVVTPSTNLKATLMEIYHQLNEEDEKQTPPQDFPEALVSLRDSNTATDASELQGRSRLYNEAAVDVNQGTEPFPSKDCSFTSDSVRTEVKDNLYSFSLKDKFTKSHQPVSKQPETDVQRPGSPVTVTHTRAGSKGTNALEHDKDETVQDHNKRALTSEKNLNSERGRGLTEMNGMLSDQNKVEENNKNIVSSQKLQTFDCESKCAVKQENSVNLSLQESSEVRGIPKSDSVTSRTPEPSPLLRKRNCVSPIPSATPEELASGARRKISTPKTKAEAAEDTTSSPDNQSQDRESPVKSSKLSQPASPSLSRRSPLLQPAGELNILVERRSPLSSRRKVASEIQTVNQPFTEEIHTEGKPAEKDKHNPFKAPQVIRKIRAEIFADASGHLKLWCQFFNVLSDSTIRWHKNEEDIVQVQRKAGDETQVSLAIVQASCRDAGVYGCSITNEYGTDSTDLLLSSEILAGMSLREDLGVGEEIEMTPLIFTKGLADSGTWGNKFFGRIMMTDSHIGDGCSHKVWRAKVIYGLEPVFESGDSCVIKVRSPITYGGKEESCLIERNLDIMKQECKIQSLAREYCKIFSAEARVIENFGPSLEVIPVYLMYRPANPVPYATVETDLKGVYKKYSDLDHTGRLDNRTGSEVERKCCALQHWIYQWTNGNLLLTRLEGVDTKITNVGISVKSTGHLGLCVEGNPKVFEHFVSQHSCNYFCGLLGLKPLKVMDSLTTPTKPRGSKSPLLQRKKSASASSPQLVRRTAVSPRLPRKAEQDPPKAGDTS